MPDPRRIFDVPAASQAAARVGDQRGARRHQKVRRVFAVLDYRFGAVQLPPVATAPGARRHARQFVVRIGLAVRKYVLKRRGVIRSDTQRKLARPLSPESIVEIEWMLSRLAAKSGRKISDVRPSRGRSPPAAA